MPLLKLKIEIIINASIKILNAAFYFLLVKNAIIIF
jgi:hypothetical protein